MSENSVGRPPMYKTKEEIEEKIEAYFLECEGVPFFDGNGDPLRANNGSILYQKQPKPPTVTGLALALGFTCRQDLLRYQGKEEFRYTITKAKSKVEEYAEMRLFDRDGVNGAKFSLINNFKGWRDRQKDDSSEELMEKLDSILEGVDHAAKR